MLIVMFRLNVNALIINRLYIFININKWQFEKLYKLFSSY